MALSYKQTELIRATIPALREDGDRITQIFYSAMLAAHPELHNIFNPTNQSSGRQAHALTTAIITFAQHAGHDTSALASRLERVCQKHCSLGIRSPHYAIVGEYLLRAFGDVLGPTGAWTPDTHAAWAAAYGILSRMLIGRENALYASFERWTGWRPFRILRRVEDAPDITSFHLGPADGVTPLPRFLPGQYVSLQLWVPTIGCMQSRQYALSDSYRPDCYRITVQRDKSRLTAAAASLRNGQAGAFGQPQHHLCPHKKNGSISTSSPPPSAGGSSMSGSTSNSTSDGTRGLNVPNGSGGSSSTASGNANGNGTAPPRGRPGLMSNMLLDHRRVGDTVELAHPAGEFYLDPAETSSLPLVLISAGIGAAPLVAILNTVADTQPARTVSWIHGYAPSSNNTGLFEEHVRGLQRKCAGLRVNVFETRLGGANLVEGDVDRKSLLLRTSVKSSNSSTTNSSGDTGSNVDVDEEDEDDVFWGVDGADLWVGNSGTEYLVCGPEVFMEAVWRGLRARGIKRSRVKFELFGTGDF